MDLSPNYNDLELGRDMAWYACPWGMLVNSFNWGGFVKDLYWYLLVVVFLSNLYATLTPAIMGRHQNQNQNCYWWHVQMTIIHQDLWWGKLVPCPYKRSELSNRVFCSFSSRKESICKWIPISNSLGEEAALVNVSISKGGLKCQRVVISDMPYWGGGDKVIRRYNGCTLQTFVKHYDSTISPPFFRDSHFSCSRMPVMLPVS